MFHGRVFQVVFVLTVVLNLANGPALASEPASPQGAAEFVNMLKGRIAANWVLNRAMSREAAPETESALLRDLIRVGFDLDTTSRIVLGKSWRRAKAEQRAEFKNLFAEYLVDSYASHFKRYRIGTLTVVASNRIADGDFLVRTTIDRAANTANVVWRIRAWDGNYRIIDIMIDGRSLALIHRSEFASVIRRNGLEKLLQILRQRESSRSGFGHHLTRLDRKPNIALSAGGQTAGR